MDKRTLITQIAETLRAELAAAERLARDTAASANHPEARPENDKDTRKIELSYLAAGQAARVLELEAALAQLAALSPRSFRDGEALESGALIALEIDGKAQTVLLCPVAGGARVKLDGREVRVVTPQSPLGAGLLGKEVGDTFEFSAAGQEREVQILSVE